MWCASIDVFDHEQRVTGTDSHQTNIISRSSGFNELCRCSTLDDPFATQSIDDVWLAFHPQHIYVQHPKADMDTLLCVPHCCRKTLMLVPKLGLFERQLSLVALSMISCVPTSNDATGEKALSIMTPSVQLSFSKMNGSPHTDRQMMNMRKIAKIVMSIVRMHFKFIKLKNWSMRSEMWSFIDAWHVCDYVDRGRVLQNSNCSSNCILNEEAFGCIKESLWRWW